MADASAVLLAHEQDSMHRVSLGTLANDLVAVRHLLAEWKQVKTTQTLRRDSPLPGIDPLGTFALVESRH